MQESKGASTNDEVTACSITSSSIRTDRDIASNPLGLSQEPLVVSTLKSTGVSSALASCQKNRPSRAEPKPEEANDVGKSSAEASSLSWATEPALRSKASTASSATSYLLSPVHVPRRRTVSRVRTAPTSTPLEEQVSPILRIPRRTRSKPTGHVGRDPEHMNNHPRITRATTAFPMQENLCAPFPDDVQQVQDASHPRPLPSATPVEDPADSAGGWTVVSYKKRTTTAARPKGPTIETPPSLAIPTTSRVSLKEVRPITVRQSAVTAQRGWVVHAAAQQLVVEDIPSTAQAFSGAQDPFSSQGYSDASSSVQHSSENPADEAPVKKKKAIRRGGMNVRLARRAQREKERLAREAAEAFEIVRAAVYFATFANIPGTVNFRRSGPWIIPETTPEILAPTYVADIARKFPILPMNVPESRSQRRRWDRINGPPGSTMNYLTHDLIVVGRDSHIPRNIREMHRHTRATEDRLNEGLDVDHLTPVSLCPLRFDLRVHVKEALAARGPSAAGPATSAGSLTPDISAKVTTNASALGDSGAQTTSVTHSEHNIARQSVLPSELSDPGKKCTISPLAISGPPNTSTGPSAAAANVAASAALIIAHRITLGRNLRTLLERRSTTPTLPEVPTNSK